MLVLQIAVPESVADESASQFFVNPGEMCNVTWPQCTGWGTCQINSSKAASWLYHW